MAKAREIIPWALEALTALARSLSGGRGKSSEDLKKKKTRKRVIGAARSGPRTLLALGKKKSVRE